MGRDVIGPHHQNLSPPLAHVRNWRRIRLLRFTDGVRPTDLAPEVLAGLRIKAQQKGLAFPFVLQSVAIVVRARIALQDLHEKLAALEQWVGPGTCRASKKL